MSTETPLGDLLEESVGERLKRLYPGWRNLPRRLWLRWKIFSRRNVIVRTIVWCGVLLVFLFGAVFYQVGEIDSRRRAADAVGQATGLYRNSLRTYDLAMADRQRCLTGVDTRNTVRAVLFDYAQGIVDVLPGQPLAIQFRDARLEFINTNYPPLDVNDCRNEPVFPSCPAALGEHSCAQIRGEESPD